MHPHNAAKNWKSDTLEQLEEIASDPQCVAIGECGLDFNRNFSDKRAQIEVFEKQVGLKRTTKKNCCLRNKFKWQKYCKNGVSDYILIRYCLEFCIDY